MKKQLLFSSLSIALALSMNAQITISSGNIFGIGDNFTQSIDTLYTGAISAGANQTWDFSNLTADEDDVLYEVVDPASTPNGSEFPTASHAFIANQDGEEATEYIIKNSTKAELLGFSGAFVQVNSNPQTIIEFPSTYNSAYTDSSAFQYTLDGAVFGFDPSSVDSVSRKELSTYTTVFDAFGSITTPLGTIDVVRSFETTTTIDSTWILFDGETEFELVSDGKDTIYRHTYWGNDPSLKFTIVEYETNASGTNVEGVVSFISETESALSTQNIVQNNISIFPNPSSDVLNIMSDSDIEQVIISDISGRMILNESSFNGSVIDVSSLKGGVYSLSIYTDGKWKNELFTKK